LRLKEASFIFQIIVMVCVRSIARYVSGAAVGGSGGEGHERGGGL
jgi:hypothetical protein